jgi:hypothetical protein
LRRIQRLLGQLTAELNALQADAHA